MVPTEPSISGESPVSAVIAVVQPPELSPMIAMWLGSKLYFVALARSQRIAALISCNCPGNFVCELDRTDTPATA